jgi:hypothetical protein
MTDRMPTLSESLGWAAAAMTLLAFACKDLRRLRSAALGANAAFTAYGFMAQLWPVLVLHLVLVPVNLCRLWQARPTPAGPPGERHIAPVSMPRVDNPARRSASA